MKLRLLAAGLMLLSGYRGCYIGEFRETRITFGQKGEFPTIVFQQTNISTPDEEPEEIRKAFDAMIEDTYNDEYLVERANEGIAVKSRELFLQNNQICMRVTGVAKSLDGMYSFVIKNDERIMVYDGEDVYEIVETNGKILKTERNTLVAWPDQQKELYWKEKLIRNADNKDDMKRFDRNASAFLRMFREYQQSHAKSEEVK